ncbi:spore cortex-lytic enzyme [Brevibacillus massiliensis]|jgi:N-acetylmuramoyl-L-alanine amidase|uniref:spore cortex-lytic enzyme n=1 Tax=Brevibacillus massiliensis TaxID=1118054 RepID=UPI0002EB2330|nr:spore cortex-lytic enzyme [Brevibacillus massiliensis]
MRMTKRMKFILLTVLLSLVAVTSGIQTVTEAFSNQVIKVGATGKDVRELQYRLKHLGFYHGAVDGQFGWQTYWALRNFQYEFGLEEVDGVLGPKSKLMLYNATKDYRPTAEELGVGTAPSAQPAAPSSPAGTTHSKRFPENELRIMAQCVYGEARGEPYEGQVAVAAVILNRVRSPQFPNTPSGVIFEPLAFTAVADGQIWLTPNDTARKAVQDAINGWDPTDGALYYFNPETATSKWIWSRPQIKKIGKHIFCY